MRERAPALMAPVVLAVVLAACSSTESVSPTLAPSAGPSAGPSATPSVSAPSTSAEPTATPEPAFSLDLPPATDPRQVQVSITPQVPAQGAGELGFTIVNLSDTRVTEIVLRWSADLGEVLLLAPFAPAESRIVDGGPPLLQDWTKWVEGPGERGEPAGTISLGWGPLDPEATLDFALVATRTVPGAVSFDLQLLAGEALLHLEGATPAELRVDVP